MYIYIIEPQWTPTVHKVKYVRQPRDFVVPRPRSYPSPSHYMRWTSWVHESLWTWIDDRPQILGYRYFSQVAIDTRHRKQYEQSLGKWSTFMVAKLKKTFCYPTQWVSSMITAICWETHGRVLQKSQHGCFVGSWKKRPWIHPITIGGPKIGWFKIWTNDQ